MSYRAFNTSSVGKGVRSNHRAQYNRFRCSSVAESLEHWDTEIESGRHINSFKTFESCHGRWTQPKELG